MAPQLTIKVNPMALMKKNYVYTDAAGLHFPDADKGDAVYYALDLSCLVNSEAETINSVTWVLPEGMTELDSLIVEDSEAQVKIQADKAGVFVIKAIIESIDEGRTSTNTHKIILKVI